MIPQTHPRIDEGMTMKTCPYCGCRTNGNGWRCCQVGIAEVFLRQKARSYPAVHHELLRLGNACEHSAAYFLIGVSLNDHAFNTGHVKAACHLASAAHTTGPHPDTLGRDWPQGPGYRTEAQAEADILHIIGQMAARSALSREQQLLRVYFLCLGWLLGQGWPRTRTTQEYTAQLTRHIQQHALLQVMKEPA